ncbi:hypothetical protein SAMN05444521_0074 [Streptomyces sp. 3214.6]|nr:hypothetical protein SAMN05444521_0074 [Streptomyces sp. 3214.6]
MVRDIDVKAAPPQGQGHGEVGSPVLGGVAGQFADDEETGVEVVADHSPLGQNRRGEVPDLANPARIGRHRHDSVMFLAGGRGR